MKRFSFVAVAVLALGCERSAVNPTDSITLQGSLQDSAGMPRASAAVKLHRGPPRVSGGTCPLLRGTPWKAATTGADGKYEFAFTGKETQTDDLLGTSEGGDLARCFRVVSEAPDEASVSADFTVQIVEVAAPTLRDYDAQLAVAGVTGSADFTWVAPPSGSKPESYALVINTEAGDPLWSKGTSGGTTNVSVPDYAFEGLASKVQLVARAEERLSGSIWPVRLESATVAVALRGTAPLSRGAACDLGTPCKLTDGDFKAATVDKEAVVITFAAPLTLKRLLLRGLSGTGDRLVVETSVDGTAYTSLSDLTYAGGFHDLESPSVLTVKSVRIKMVKTSSSGSEPRISQLAEVSVVP